MHLLILFTAFLHLNALPLLVSDEPDLDEAVTQTPASIHYSRIGSTKRKSPVVMSRRPQFPKTNSVKKEIVDGEAFSKRLGLSAFYPCDHYDEQKKECTYVRALGTTLTFGVQIETKRDESSPIRWFRFFKINDESKTIYKQALHRDAIPWNINIGGDNTELRISPVTETDFSYNFFLVSLGDASPKDQQYIKFVIEPIDVDMGPLYQGEEIAINIRSFIELPKRSFKFEWSTVQLKEGSLMPGNLRSNMRLIRGGSGLIIKEHRSFEDITLTCAMYSDKSFFVARRNFFLRKTVTQSEPDAQNKGRSQVFHRTKKSIDEEDIGQESNFQNVFIPPMPPPQASDNILKTDQEKEFWVSPKSKRLDEKYYNRYENNRRTKKTLKYFDHPQPPDHDSLDSSAPYDSFRPEKRSSKKFIKENHKFRNTILKRNLRKNKLSSKKSSHDFDSPFSPDKGAKTSLNQEDYKIKAGRGFRLPRQSINYPPNREHSNAGKSIFNTGKGQLDNQLPRRFRKKRSVGNRDEHSYFFEDVVIPWQTSVALENTDFDEVTKRRWDFQGFPLPLIDPSSTSSAASHQSLQRLTGKPAQSQSVLSPRKSTNGRLNSQTNVELNLESPSYSGFLPKNYDGNILNEERKMSFGTESKQSKMTKYLPHKRVLAVTIEEAINRIGLTLSLEKRTKLPTEFFYNAVSKHTSKEINLMSVRASETKTIGIDNDENGHDAIVLASEIGESSFYYQSMEVEAESFHFRSSNKNKFLNNKNHFLKAAAKNNFSIKDKKLESNDGKIRINSTENSFHLSSLAPSQQLDVLSIPRDDSETKEFHDIINPDSTSSDPLNSEDDTNNDGLFPSSYNKHSGKQISHRSRSSTRRKRSIEEFYSYPSTLHRFNSFKGKKSVVSREVQEGESMPADRASRRLFEDEEDSRSQAFRYVRETSPQSEDPPSDYPTPLGAFDEIEMTEAVEPIPEASPDMPMNFYNVRKPLEDTSTSSYTLQPPDDNKASRLNKLVQEANNIAEDAADDRKLKKLKVISNDRMTFGDRESLLIHSCRDDSECGVYAACFQIASGDTFCKCKPHYRGNGLFCWLL